MNEIEYDLVQKEKTVEWYVVKQMVVLIYE